MVCQVADAAKLDAWIDTASKEATAASEAGAAWRPPSGKDWHNNGSLGRLIREAMHNVRCPQLGNIALAITRWPGDGGFPRVLTTEELREQLRLDRPPLAPRVSSKTKPGPRFAFAIPAIGQLLKADLPALRAALRAAERDEAEERPATKDEVLALAAAQLKNEREARAKAEQAARVIQDTHGKYKERERARIQRDRETRRALEAQGTSEAIESFELGLDTARDDVAAAWERMEERLADALKRKKGQKRAVNKSTKRLRRAQTAEDELKAARAEIDELRFRVQQLEAEKAEAARMGRIWALSTASDSPCTSGASAAANSACMATCSAPRVKGRFGTRPWHLRPAIMEMLGHGTPLMAVAPAMFACANLFAPGLPFEEPSRTLVRNVAFEQVDVGELCADLQVHCLPIELAIPPARSTRSCMATRVPCMTLSVGCAPAAAQIAQCKRVLSFGFDGTTKLQFGLLSTNHQIELSDGSIIDVVLRGAALTEGGEALDTVHLLESKFFARGRRQLTRLRSVYEEQNGKGSWARDGLPAPSRLGSHQLGNGCVLMTDTCNPARCERRMLREAVQQAIPAAMGEVAWAALSTAERAKLLRCYEGDCMQHMRNFTMDAMAAAAKADLEDGLADSLELFSSYDRMSTDPMALIRAVYKECHPSGKYYKGRGREFEGWRVTDPLASKAPFMKLERAEGGRQDLAFDGCVPIFVDRLILARFMSRFVLKPDHENVLESFLWSVLSSHEITAMLRAVTLFDLLIWQPMRWLAGSSSKLDDWSIVSMADVMDMAHGVRESTRTVSPAHAYPRHLAI